MWKKVRIPLTGIDPGSPFNIHTVKQIRFYLYDLKISWYNAEGVLQWIDYHPDQHEYGTDGQFVFHLGEPDSYGKDTYPVRFWPYSESTHH
ncbi:MAG: hypothetical protein JRH07_18110 [Deltaproteobacteria bacterium]|nr:hypothetical protein [Deltaproteobacteria bacterium]